MVFCDSAPVLERRWAQRAGLGWIGKSGLLIHPTLGSYCLIGELITTLPLDYDTPQKERCGTCTACIKACPTEALSAYEVNANRCISYLTIEHREPYPMHLHHVWATAYLVATPASMLVRGIKKQSTSHG